MLAFVGAWFAAREEKLLRFASGTLWRGTRAEVWIEGFTALVSCAACGLLTRAAWDLVRLEREFDSRVTEWLPSWPLVAAMPLGFAAVGFVLAWRHPWGWPGRVLSGSVMAAGGFLAAEGGWLYGRPAGVGVGVLILAGLLGAPLFVPLGAIPLLLFLSEEIPAAAIPGEILRLANSPFLPAIPLFTLAGFLLTEGGAPARLLRFFRAFFGWLPGGTAVIAALLCAFFSIFTGGSGVTILALGGLLFAALKSEGYEEEASIGLLTGSGSLGILLPPALPLILFGIAAEVPIEELFRAGVVPGLIMIGLVALFAARTGLRTGVPRQPFDAREAGRALWQARTELLAPAVAVGALFSGRATLLEASALTAVWVLLAQTLVHGDVAILPSKARGVNGAGRAPLADVLRDCAALLGGVLLILACAQGLSNWLVDAQVPGRLLAVIQTRVDSPLAFLLGLNLFLLAVGCFLDVYSATFVVVPLILPVAKAYGIDPVHLGIVFVANLELGYLTPPVGLNLFLASYRFDRPLLRVARSSLPIFVLLLLGVLLITYVPALTHLLR